MNPSLKEFNQLKAQVAELMAWKKEKEKQQLKYPIDKVSMKALDEAFRSTIFTQINVGDVYFQPQQTKSSVKGQMRFMDIRGGVQQMSVTTTTNPPDGANFTGSINLTAI